MSATDPQQPNAVPAITPPGNNLNKAKTKSKRSAGRSYRRPEEDRAGPDYLERMEQLGPRVGESRFAFRGRMAQIKEQRRIMIEAARRCHGNLSDTCRELGLSRHNMTRHLMVIGIASTTLTAFAPDAAYK